MKIPVCNHVAGKLMLVIEPLCEQYEMPQGGMATVTLDDHQPHEICIYDQQITI